MKYILIGWFLVAWTGVCLAQTITLVDQQTRLPLEGVTLISENPRATEVTNAQGQADISAFRGAAAIQLRYLGYQTTVISYQQLQASRMPLALQSVGMGLEQVVVSATRWQQTTGNVPSKVVAISAREVALQNPQTAADLLGVSGKVYIQKSQQGGGSPMIRGFATNRLIYTIDGVRMNTAIFRGGNLQNVISLDPFATERTEVLFGPGSVIYGSDAIGGVMSFQTLTPQLSHTGEPLVVGKAVARYSSANQERTAHFDVGVGWRKWSMVTSFSSWDFDHLRQGSHGPTDYLKDFYVQRQNNTDVVITQTDPLLQIPSAYSQVNLMQKVRFQPNPHWDFQYGFHYSATSPYGRYDRHNRRRNGTARYSEWDYGPQLWAMHHLALTHQRPTAAYDQLSLRLALQSFAESRIERNLHSPERQTTTEGVDAYSLNLDLVKSVGARHSLFYGLEYVLNTVVSTGQLTDISTGEEAPGPARYPQAHWYSAAAYLNHVFKVSNQLTLQAGLRYNQFALDADFSRNLAFYPFPFTTANLRNGALTGSLGSVYKPNASWALTANFGTAFRSPNVDDLGKVFDSEPGAVTVPNPDLEAEYAYNLDLGLAKVWGDAVKVDLTGYYTILQNALVRRNFRLNDQDSLLYGGVLSQVQAIQNAAVAHVYGIQVGLEIKLPAGFSLLSDLNYQVGREELDDGATSPSRHAAPLFGVSRLRFTHRGLTLEFNAQYQGQRRFADLAPEEQAKDEIYAKDDQGRNYAPAWYTLNFKGIYQLTDTLSLSSGLENLTDQRYRPYSSGISGAGRNVVLALRVGF